MQQISDFSGIGFTSDKCNKILTTVPVGLSSLTGSSHRRSRACPNTDSSLAAIDAPSSRYGPPAIAIPFVFGHMRRRHSSHLWHPPAAEASVKAARSWRAAYAGEAPLRTPERRVLPRQLRASYELASAWSFRMTSGVSWATGTLHFRISATRSSWSYWTLSVTVPVVAVVPEVPAIVMV